MIRYFAATTAQELVVSTVGQWVGLDRGTAQHYASWLETVFLVHRVPAWSRNLTAKVVRRPKLYLTDTGVAGALLGKDAATLQRPTDPAGGVLFETFVANEIAKQLAWCETPALLFHFRESDGAEVDLVLEADDGRVVAIEVKATSAPRPEDFRWLTYLRDRLDSAQGEFTAGVVLHTGQRRLLFGIGWSHYRLPTCGAEPTVPPTTRRNRVADRSDPGLHLLIVSKKITLGPRPADRPSRAAQSAHAAGDHRVVRRVGDPQRIHRSHLASPDRHRAGNLPLRRRARS